MTALNADRAAARTPIDVAEWSRSFPHRAPVFERIAAHAEFSRVRWSPFRIVKLTTWSMGRAALLGDAAHAMPPNLGQGGGRAMMNALSLAHFVADAPDVPAALAAWEHSGRPPTEDTQRLSGFYAAVTNWPPRLRDLVFAATARVGWLRKQYQKTANPVPVGIEHA